MKKIQKSKKGFTLVEMVLVIAYHKVPQWCKCS